MITIFFCDDSSETVNRYSSLIKHTAKKNQLDISLSAFNNGRSLLFYMADTPDLPDIIYLDILMKDINGVNTAKKLREMGCNAEIIFLTSSNDYVFESFDVSPVYYLLKTETSEAKFEQVFLRAVHLSENKATQKFICKSGALRKIIPIKEISHLIIWKGIVTIHYGKNETFDYWTTMEELEEQLREKNFVRTHRSYIVNLQYIAEFQRRKIILKTGETIPVGVTYEEKLKNTFLDYMTRNNTIF